MDSLADELTAFITRYALELSAGFAFTLVIVALILLMVLTRRRSEQFLARLQDSFAALGGKQERLEKIVRDEIVLNRQESADTARQTRQELSHSLNLSGESIQQRLMENVHLQKDQLDSFSKQLVAMAKLNEDKIEAVRQTMASQLRNLQADNSAKLEQMRATVDEKLQNTLEKRLAESKPAEPGAKSVWATFWSRSWPPINMNPMWPPEKTVRNGWNMPLSCPARMRMTGLLSGSR